MKCAALYPDRGLSRSVTSISQFSRLFSAAPTSDVSPSKNSIEMGKDVLMLKPTRDVVEDSIVADSTRTSPNTKRRNRNAPSTAQADALFDEIALHMPLKTLVAIIKKLEKTKLCDTTTRVGRVHNLLETPEMPEWTQRQFKEFLLRKPKQETEANANKEQLESNIKLLEQARDLSAQRPLLWSISQRKKMHQQRKAAATDREDLDDSSVDKTALLIHSQKSRETREEEARELAVLLAERLPEDAHSQLMDVFRTYVEKPRKMRMLYSYLQKCTKAHIHLVASQVATFFYVKHAENDPRLKQHEKEWNKAKQDFSASILRIYDSLEEKETRKTSKDKIAVTLEDLDRLRTRPSDGVKIGRDRQGEKGKDGRRRKQAHLVFDAILLQDQWKPSSRHCERTIFVDNLPVGMEESELVDLYSRCGPVESAQIFNQRMELDPGPRTAKQRRELQVRQKQNLTRNRRRWIRVRTPIYGRITFSSQEGYAYAVDAPMRLFGMVVRKHPMRSIRATDMTSLFLEEIPAGIYSLDIEHRLSKLLHPEIYVCLDVGQHDYTEPSSCEIKFPTFEMADHAYHKLQDLDIEGIVLNWMRTPEDAEKYWTREYTFET